MGRPAIVNIDHYQGDRLEVFFRVRERIWSASSQSWEIGDYINFTGGVPKGHVKASKDDLAPFVTFDCSLSNQATVPGGVLAVLSPAQTTLMIERTYYYDIQVERGASQVDTYIAGVIVMEKEVTRNV